MSKMGVPMPTVRPRGGSASQGDGATQKSVGLWLTVIVLTMLILHIPRRVMTTNLEPSWGGVLEYAHGKNLQFGTDIVFTYGPLGYLEQSFFSGQPAGTRMVFDLVMDLTIAIGVCLAAWRACLPWRILLLGLFALLTATVGQATIELPLEAGLFCWSLLCFLEKGPHRRLFSSVLLAFAVVVSMMKCTHFVMASISVASVAGSFVLCRNARGGCGLIVGYVAGLVGFWMFLGQNPLHLVAYLKNSLSVVAGYQAAMGLPSGAAEMVDGMVAVILALLAAVIRSSALYNPPEWRSRIRRFWFIAWVFCILFLCWKHGFVRNNSDLLAGFVPVVALALEGMPAPSGGRATLRVARGGTLLCCVLALLIECWRDPDHLKGLAVGEAVRFADNARALLNPVGYFGEMNKTLGVERDRAQLPKLSATIGRGTVDVFGQNQAYALFNDLNYQPRPSIQSYCAYNAMLMDLNERAFAPTVAPEYVMLSLHAIDGRFPPMEDARVLRTLLADYTLVNAEVPFLLLKHWVPPAPRPRTVLIREGVVQACLEPLEGVPLPSQIINVADYSDADLWLEILMEPSLAGRVLQGIYQPPVVGLEVWSRPPSRPAVFRAPVTMLAAGFIASPLLLQTEDIKNLYIGLAVDRPHKFGISLESGTQALWQDRIRYRIYSFDRKLGRHSIPDPVQ